MANSAPPVQDYMLKLAAGRLTPERIALLQYKLATGSPTAMKIMHAIKPGEWERAVGDTREFNDIKSRLEDAIDAWEHSKPTSKGFVWPQPAPVQELTPTPSTNTDAQFAQLEAHIAAFMRPGPVVRKKSQIVFVTDRRQSKPSPPAVDQEQQAKKTDEPPINWSLKEKPKHFRRYGEAVYKYLKSAFDGKVQTKPAAPELIEAWLNNPVAPIVKVEHGLVFYRSGQGTTVKISTTPDGTREAINKVIKGMTEVSPT